MLSLRHLPICASLIACSVYDESLLADSQLVDGGAGRGNGGSGGANAASGGSAVAEQPDEGDAHGGDGSVPGDVEGGSSNGSGSSPSVAGGGGTDTNHELGGSGATMGGVGVGGGGGTSSAPTGVDMLDDMEDGNFYLFAKPPRFGYWYLAGDMTAGAKLPKIEQLMGAVDPERDGSRSAVHFTASGFKGWGASLGLSFADASQKRTPYDAGNAVGVSFWLRGTVADGAKLRVLFPVLGTDTTGKDCGGDSQGQCLDHFATQLTVEPEWQQITIPFSSLHQAGWGAPLNGFDPAHLLGIEWTAGIASVDVWLDDLVLLRP